MAKEILKLTLNENIMDLTHKVDRARRSTNAPDGDYGKQCLALAAAHEEALAVYRKHYRRHFGAESRYSCTAKEKE